MGLPRSTYYDAPPVETDDAEIVAIRAHHNSLIFLNISQQGPLAMQKEKICMASAWPGNELNVVQQA